MLILQGVWSLGGGLRLWAEDAELPAVAAPPAGALDLLLRLAGLEAGLEEEPGRRLVRAGDSLRFLAEVAGLALALVAAGRTLPGLVVEEAGLAARWRPVPRPDDTARLRLLARAMPPVCRAEQVGDSLEGRQAGEVLGEVLDGLVDAAARSALAGRRLLPARRGRRPGAVPAAEAWLAALTAA